MMKGNIERENSSLATIIAALIVGSWASFVVNALHEIRESYSYFKELVIQVSARRELTSLLRSISTHQEMYLLVSEQIVFSQNPAERFSLERKLETIREDLDQCVLKLREALRESAVDKDAEIEHLAHEILVLFREQGIMRKGLRGESIVFAFGIPDGMIEINQDVEVVDVDGVVTGCKIDGLEPGEKSTQIGVTIGDVDVGIHDIIIAGRDTHRGSRQASSLFRYSDVSFPSHTSVQQTEVLRVAITLEPTSNQSAELALEPPDDEGEPMKVDACLVVSPLDFDLESPNVQTIEVPLDDDSAPVIFKLVPKSVGRKTIAVEFFQDSRYLGRAEVETTVGEKPRESHPVSAHSGLVLRPQQLAPDLTIYIEEAALEENRRLYRFLLLSPIHELNLNFEEAGEIELQTPPEVYFEELFAELNDWLRERDVDDNLFFKRLSSLGANLYDQLFPDNLKRIYWEKLRDEVETVQIISADPWIPWELVRPYHPETLEEDDFLCEQFALTRWLAGSSSPDVIELQKLALVVAASDLSAAVDEAEALRKLPGIEVKDIAPSLLGVYDLLETGSFQGVHFACHGEYDRQNPDQSVVLLEAGQRFRPNDIAGKKRTFGRDEPLVFLNACETGRAGLSLTGLGGWARAFIGAGAGGFIGSTWHAHDESAYKFAVAFYGYILEGATVAEAARLARREIRRAGDPTWLSYTVYANPLARLAAETE